MSIDDASQVLDTRVDMYRTSPRSREANSYARQPKTCSVGSNESQKREIFLSTVAGRRFIFILLIVYPLPGPSRQTKFSVDKANGADNPASICQRHHFRTGKGHTGQYHTPRYLGTRSPTNRVPQGKVIWPRLSQTGPTAMVDRRAPKNGKGPPQKKPCAARMPLEGRERAAWANGVHRKRLCHDVWSRRGGEERGERVPAKWARQSNRLLSWYHATFLGRRNPCDVRCPLYAHPLRLLRQVQNRRDEGWFLFQRAETAGHAWLTHCPFYQSVYSILRPFVQCGLLSTREERCCWRIRLGHRRSLLSTHAMTK